jgi:cobalamin biosynthesis Mg chelatase CobN
MIKIKNTKNLTLFLISVMVLFLTLNTVIAHPGHGNLYPDEVTDDTINSNTDNGVNSNKANSGTSNDDSSSNGGSGSSNGAFKDTSTKSSTVSQDKSSGDTVQDNNNQNGNQSVEEVTDTNDTNPTSNGFQWDTVIIVCFIITGLIGVGFLFKTGRFD